jgi:hypothetical protein
MGREKQPQDTENKGYTRKKEGRKIGMSQRHTNSSALSILVHPNLDRPLSTPFTVAGQGVCNEGFKKVGSAVYPTREREGHTQ